MDNKYTKTVVNLSDFALDKYQIGLLSKGLKFCPTPCFPDPGQQREDLDSLHRRVRQIAYFESEEGEYEPPTQDPDPNKLRSLKPFKHRNFKLPSAGRGPPAPGHRRRGCRP